MDRQGPLLGDEFVVAPGQVGDPYWPVLAHDETDGGFMLLWSELNGSVIHQPYFDLAAYNLYALALDSDGTPLASTPTLVTDQLTFYPVPSPGYDVAYNTAADEYLVVWQQPPGIIIGDIAHPHRVMGRKLTATGALGGSEQVFRVGR